MTITILRRAHLPETELQELRKREAESRARSCERCALLDELAGALVLVSRLSTEKKNDYAAREAAFHDLFRDYILNVHLDNEDPVPKRGVTYRDPVK